MSWYSGIKKGTEIVFQKPDYPQIVEVEVLEIVGLSSCLGLKPNPILATKVVEANIPGTTPAFLLSVRLGGYQELNVLTDGETFWSHTDPIHTKSLKSGWVRRDEILGSTATLPPHAKQFIKQKVKEFAEQVRGETNEQGD